MAKVDWSWLPAAMPRVQALMGEVRQAYGAEWVAQCWRAGVVQGQPGHFWAAQGVLAVGVPWDMDLVRDWLRLRESAPGAAMVVIRDPAGQVGRHVHVLGGEHGA